MIVNKLDIENLKKMKILGHNRPTRLENMWEEMIRLLIKRRKNN